MPVQRGRSQLITKRVALLLVRGSLSAQQRERRFAVLGEPCLAILERGAELLLAAFDALLPVGDRTLVAGDVAVEGGALVAVEDPSEGSALVRQVLEPLTRVLEVVAGALQLGRGTMLVGQEQPEPQEPVLGGTTLAGGDVVERERLGVAVAEHLDEAFS